MSEVIHDGVGAYMSKIFHDGWEAAPSSSAVGSADLVFPCFLAGLKSFICSVL